MLKCFTLNIKDRKCAYVSRGTIGFCGSVSRETEMSKMPLNSGVLGGFYGIKYNFAPFLLVKFIEKIFGFHPNFSHLIVSQFFYQKLAVSQNFYTFDFLFVFLDLLSILIGYILRFFNVSICIFVLFGRRVVFFQGYIDSVVMSKRCYLFNKHGVYANIGAKCHYLVAFHVKQKFHISTFSLSENHRQRHIYSKIPCKNVYK